jgi:predicted ATPase
LELPTDDSLTDTEAAGAVQLFLLQARRVRPGFALTADNCAQVAAVCRRLDGLPLAIELAAARVKLLSPQALLARLDRALDLNSGQADRPVRQQTLRDTIAWSHDLLSADLQAFFRRLGVFSGGADLAAIGAVTHDVAGAVDPLEPVAELVDASLVSVNATPDGEPRVALLETVRAFSHEQLRNAGELDVTAERHARHFTLIAERLAQLFAGERHPEAFSQFETEHDNFREALAWTVRPEPGEPDRVGLGLRLASTLGAFWNTGGYFSEARRWLELVLGRWDGRASPEAAHCLHTLSQVLLVTGDLDGAYDRASLAVDVTRRLHGARPDAIRGLADIETLRGHRARARSLFEEAVALGRRGGDRRGLGRVLGAFALFEIFEGNYARSLQLETEALEIARDVGDSASALRYQHNVACTLRQTGRIDEAEQQFRELIPQVVRLRDMEHLAVLAEDYGAVLADSGKPERAVRLLGAADAMRQRLGISRDELQEAELAEPLEKTRTALLPQQWAATYENGRSLTVEDALLEHDTEPLDGAGCMPPAGERAPHRTS